MKKILVESFISYLSNGISITLYYFQIWQYQANNTKESSRQFLCLLSILRKFNIVIWFCWFIFNNQQSHVTMLKFAINTTWSPAVFFCQPHTIHYEASSPWHLSYHPGHAWEWWILLKDCWKTSYWLFYCCWTLLSSHCPTQT